MAEPSFIQALVAGGGAGISVDLVLYPLDTVKTRLQSAQGFGKAGGFRGIYAGLGSVAVGSVPGASLFFVSYETVRKLLHPICDKSPHLKPAVDMLAASSGEVVACMVRVPTEVVKQRAQASPHLSTASVFSNTLKLEGITGFYRGYLSTVMREIPFSFIQFPIWEYLKTRWSHRQGRPVDPWQSSVSGALSGAIGAGITTPLDVAKTRIMLAKVGTVEAEGNILKTLKIVHFEKGIPGLFAGVLPRTMWMSLGGAIFLGVYEKIKRGLQDLSSDR